ncbi:hypothetical protein FACS189440_01460 [Bacteroidia bacterium]|nr:hypothetical protein FACS189423_08440 [Bacteroidia bacterium]GHT45442.1 hypothetical protein FACS189440_01460 [Bacteroidia bacterium]
MKQKIFLMLTLLIWSAASMNAQVNIGSTDGPQPGAILDLSQGSQKLGLILPNVPLATVGAWQLDAGTGVEGTVVYNTNENLLDAAGSKIGKGIFVWIGNGWQAAKSGAGSLLALGFDLTPATGVVNAFVGGTIEFTASDFLPAGAAPGVNWVIPSGSASIAAIQASTVTTCIVEGLSVGQATLAVTSLDGNVTKTVTIDVQPAPVPVSDLTLDSEAAYTAPSTGGSINRTATIAPDNAAEKGVNWTSDNPDVTITPSNPVASGTPVTITVAAGSDAITGATVTASAVGDGTKTKTITINRDAPSYPAGTIVIPNAKTGFISGAYTSYASVPSTTSGSLLIAAADGNSGSTNTWDAISGYNSIAYANTDARKFEGANAGCEDGWRLPSIVELKAIADYFQLTYGSYQGPTSTQVPGFSQLKNQSYWSSTFRSADYDWGGSAWLVDVSTGQPWTLQSLNWKYIRCVREI